MKTITTREYDAEGRLIRETTVTEDYASSGYVAAPRFPGVYLTGSCTCGRPWNSITAPPPCPVHGQAQHMQITCSTNAISAGRQ